MKLVQMEAIAKVMVHQMGLMGLMEVMPIKMKQKEMNLTARMLIGTAMMPGQLRTPTNSLVSLEIQNAGMDG